MLGDEVKGGGEIVLYCHFFRLVRRDSQERPLGLPLSGPGPSGPQSGLGPDRSPVQYGSSPGRVRHGSVHGPLLSEISWTDVDRFGPSPDAGP